ncbi:MAG TPA: hypothetical protein VJ732_07570 [Bryobacteraceae bacterium]|nr:hypothetical protein [Bryobacteraceae bacterium]
MEWNRSNAIGLAKATCTYCRGGGLRLLYGRKEVPCRCVFRGVFRACLQRFRECVAAGAHTSSVSLEFCQGADGRRAYSRKREEFMADFCLVSRRSLDDFEYKIFRFHFLLGADAKLCQRYLRIDRGAFYHQVYRIEQRLGRIYAELQPYALYPVSEYFAGVILKAPRQPAFPDGQPDISPVPLPLYA